jgi:hypothetical protein
MFAALTTLTPEMFTHLPTLNRASVIIRDQHLA